MKPFAAASEQNREPILAVLRELFANTNEVLEIGSGTGQHAVYFANALPHLIWHTSDLPEAHLGIKQWLDEAGLDNVRYPLKLDVLQSDWPELSVDGVFSANTLHIMNWEMVQACFRGVSEVLGAGGIFAVYGPFNYGGQYTSPGNARFDDWLRSQGDGQGIRNFEDLNVMANENGLSFYADYEMPVNNRILCWQQSK